MSVAEWVDTYGIHHWRIIWSSYRKLAWVGFEPTTTEFRSDTLTNWAIRPWVQLALGANFVQLLQFHRLSKRLMMFVVYIYRKVQSAQISNMIVSKWASWHKTIMVITIHNMYYTTYIYWVYTYKSIRVYVYVCDVTSCKLCLSFYLFFSNAARKRKMELLHEVVAKKPIVAENLNWFC